MNHILGLFLAMLPGIVIALAVTAGVVVSFRTRRTYVIVLVWLGIITLAVLAAQLGTKRGL